MMDVSKDPLKKTPMWVGWNANMEKTNTQNKQSVFYMPQINESPTSTSVVRETMKKAQDVAKECNKESIAVTYD